MIDCLVIIKTKTKKEIHATLSSSVKLYTTVYCIGYNLITAYRATNTSTYSSLASDFLGGCMVCPPLKIYTWHHLDCSHHGH